MNCELILLPSSFHYVLATGGRVEGVLSGDGDDGGDDGGCVGVTTGESGVLASGGLLGGLIPGAATGVGTGVEGEVLGRLFPGAPIGVESGVGVNVLSLAVTSPSVNGYLAVRGGVDVTFGWVGGGPVKKFDAAAGAGLAEG